MISPTCSITSVDIGTCSWFPWNNFIQWSISQQNVKSVVCSQYCHVITCSQCAYITYPMSPSWNIVLSMSTGPWHFILWGHLVDNYENCDACSHAIHMWVHHDSCEHSTMYVSKCSQVVQELQPPTFTRGYFWFSGSNMGLILGDVVAGPHSSLMHLHLGFCNAFHQHEATCRHIPNALK